MTNLKKYATMGLENQKDVFIYIYMISIYHDLIDHHVSYHGLPEGMVYMIYLQDLNYMV